MLASVTSTNLCIQNILGLLGLDSSSYLYYFYFYSYFNLNLLYKTYDNSHKAVINSIILSASSLVEVWNNLSIYEDEILETINSELILSIYSAYSFFFFPSPNKSESPFTLCPNTLR